jgi:hypothetical protein
MSVRPHHRGDTSESNPRVKEVRTLPHTSTRTAGHGSHVLHMKRQFQFQIIRKSYIRLKTVLPANALIVFQLR